MQKIVRTFSWLAAVAILLAACAPASTTALLGSQWQLVSLNGQALDASAPAITLDFQTADQIGGSGGCNGYGGNYTANAQTGKISFSQIISTMMACLDGNVMADEQAYFQALNSVSQFRIEGDTLTMTNGSQTLVFSRA